MYLMKIARRVTYRPSATDLENLSIVSRRLIRDSDLRDNRESGLGAGRRHPQVSIVRSLDFEYIFSGDFIRRIEYYSHITSSVRLRASLLVTPVLSLHQTGC